MQNGGVFARYLTYEDLLYGLSERRETVTVGEKIFVEAREFYNKKDNRKFLLPVIDEEGMLLSFMRWNNQKIEEKEPNQSIETIEQAVKLYIRECNEQVYLWLLDFLEGHSGREIILQGEG